MVTPDDYAAQLRARGRRGWLAIAGVLLVGVAALIVGLTMLVDEAGTPNQPLGSFSLSSERRSFALEVPRSSTMALWVEVEQIQENATRSGYPSDAPTLILEADGQSLRCATNDVVAYGVFSRAGSRVSWTGRLSRCSIDVEAGTTSVAAWWELPARVADEVTVERVVLTPSLPD